MLATTLATMTSFQMVFFGKNDKPFWRKVIIFLIKFIRKSHDAKVQNQSQILKGATVVMLYLALSRTKVESIFRRCIYSISILSISFISLFVSVKATMIF